MSASLVEPVTVPAQLSVVVGAVAVAEHSPVTSAKVGVTGGVTSFTVTVNWHRAVADEQLLVNVILTVVTPLLNVEPLPVPVPVPVVAPLKTYVSEPHEPVAVYVTTALQLAFAFAVIFPGQEPKDGAIHA